MIDDKDSGFDGLDPDEIPEPQGGEGGMESAGGMGGMPSGGIPEMPAMNGDGGSEGINPFDSKANDIWIDNPKDYFTVNGAAIPVGKNDTKKTAIKKFLNQAEAVKKGIKNPIKISKKEYAIAISAIDTYAKKYEKREGKICCVPTPKYNYFFIYGGVGGEHLFFSRKPIVEYNKNYNLLEERYKNGTGKKY